MGLKNIKETLLSIGSINEVDIEVFSTKTRDIENLKVYKDKRTGVIFIDDFYVGDSEYISGNYRSTDKLNNADYSKTIENEMDTFRRFETTKKFIASKILLDFGCGSGSYLNLCKPITNCVYGVELQSNFVKELNNKGILSFERLSKAPPNLDVITMFHCLEHLVDPLSILSDVKSKLNPINGLLIIEVPHARDFLIDKLEVRSFIDFTLWSQHLVLHTRESLSLLLNKAGFKDIFIQGIQRYNISNHLNWIANGKPGGHTLPLSIIETNELRYHYSSALQSIDATDTLLAIASV